ncbi:C-X-C motif chemokine 16 isoform X1 [Cricetulus griseus]|uniref:C-X-C motif chemokine 16 n=1 Tax=Cricetulus griseus TaxID=10029 RepID=A0A9J7JXA2_CRIGR|nr:C-X-C motif chemokine 16 isoform X1 [Cricetulus griseus]XP_027282730.1 C-X-C motif chemokine 16 isoform X2 [Cricetulus griseus]XP_027282731.1 C-X-C motif chemokine 16 isoform X2 [Cricetulus griseus]ERE69347.1 c-X-C motif chemokine 16-like protein [Cricetulus griseus]
MRQSFGLLPRVLFLFLLALLTQPGDGNQGSATGSCSCGKTIAPGTLVPPATLTHIRKHLKAYDRCPFLIRFHLKSTSVCGRKQDQWVREVISCFENKECGHGHGKSLPHQEPLPHASTQIPVTTEGTPPDTSTPAQIQSTHQSTFPSGALSLNKELTPHSETTAVTSGYETTAVTSGYETTAVTSGCDPEARPKAKANKKQQENKQQKEKPESSAGTPGLVPVLSLLVIVFFLTAAVVYMLCTRRRVRQQRSADLQLRYAPVNQDSRA